MLSTSKAKSLLTSLCKGRNLSLLRKRRAGEDFAF